MTHENTNNAMRHDAMQYIKENMKKITDIGAKSVRFGDLLCRFLNRNPIDKVCQSLAGHPI